MGMAAGIIMTGMHRSGTSALSGALQLIGVHLGSNLLPPSTHQNEKGFFEHLKVYEQHERLLRNLNRAWDDVRPLPDGWELTPAARETQKHLVEILRTDIIADSKVWSVKDPRTCRLLPLWHLVCEELAVSPVYIIPWRDPVEVALSLSQRNGLSAERSGVLWAAHLLEAERATRSARRCFVRYDRLIDDPQAVLEDAGQVLKIDWP